MGVREWFRLKGWNKERTLMAFHRITGWALTLFIVGHVVFVHEVRDGISIWNSLLTVDSSVFGKVLLLGIMMALIFHAINGIRIMLIESGHLLTKPKEQEYPYTTWLTSRRHQIYVMAMGTIGIVLTVYAGVVIFS
ncbi:succinate dehydrogenase, cytochrome b556 subunit [Metallosphaera hakonensis]|uniref:Succinate dehydrogenase n=1 Tax=Metallosphaera hakonensis JCM 8857 = DSM 7519 TaxID=1293036 RepID=A0A2U9IWB8_9CREN|nr:succinate dehydrogenase [Metallosphaera hakonensis]AWS00305.1 succinate dehydrogenase [Metallosphaera hakonensis JCM 8857 = DSM 7519]